MPAQEVALHDLVLETLELLAGKIAQRNVEVNVSRNLPRVFGDRLRLVQMLQNLIENAVKFMGNQLHPRIDIGLRVDHQETVCFVRDNGKGLEPRYLEKIFGLFERLDTDTQGTGIGLALVARIIGIHDGRIWVESEGPGHGSTFCFVLPWRV